MTPGAPLGGGAQAPFLPTLLDDRFNTDAPTGNAFASHSVGSSGGTARSPYLPISPKISLYLPISPYISPWKQRRHGTRARPSVSAGRSDHSQTCRDQPHAAM